MEKYYEALKYNHPISYTLSAYDIINLVFSEKKQKIIFKDMKTGKLRTSFYFNQYWKLLHSDIFEETFINTIKELNKKASFEPTEEEIEKTLRETTSDNFIKVFNILYNSDEDTLKFMENINVTIQNLFSVVINYLNKKRSEKYVDTENIKGGIGVSITDL